MVGQFLAGVKIRIGCLKPALSPAQKWAEMLNHPSIYYLVLLKKLSILSIDQCGENSFFHPLLPQAKFASGAFGAHCLALSSQFRGRGEEKGGSWRKGSPAGEPPVNRRLLRA